MLAKSTPQSHHAIWVGLVMEGPSLEGDARALAGILGDAAGVVVVPEEELPLRTVHRLVQTHATALLAIGHAGQQERLSAILRVAATLASIRRIVLLHDAPAGPAFAADTPAILVLRDGPGARRALDAIVSRDRADTDLPARLPGASGAWQARAQPSDPVPFSNTSLA
jgi:hypothetical protein